MEKKMPRPYRLAFGSCSHPALPQPLWPIISSRQPAAFIWGGDSIYADSYVGLNWTAVGLQRSDDEEGGGERRRKWRVIFPPPSIHLEAGPDVIRGWYERQLQVEGYKQFLWGFDDNLVTTDDEIASSTPTTKKTRLSRPFIFGTIDDHDFGQNNGDITYQYRKESNVAFMDFIHGDVFEGDEKECTLAVGEKYLSQSTEVLEESCNSSHRIKGRSKISDPMYQRALQGKGVYGVQLFDFERKVNVDDGSIVWGGGYWVPEYLAKIDPDVIDASTNDTTVNYSTTHSVAVFALDVRSNKTPWPKGKDNVIKKPASYSSNRSMMNIPALDFLGAHQWEWFQSALSNSHARVNIIVSGLQVHPDRGYDGNLVEEWSKFPESRNMLYDMILNSGAKSPLLISGDVHMSQLLRKDCIRTRDIQKLNSESDTQPPKRPLIEVTASGMTHSWGTSFSSQPKHHTWPLWPYSHLVSTVFMQICHFVCPWNDIITSKMGKKEEFAQMVGLTGKQYYLGLNFAEIEFDFADDDSALDEGSGAITVRIFGKNENESPKLEARWTFDQLSGVSSLPGMTAKIENFLTVGIDQAADWICVPYRGLPSAVHCSAAIAIQVVVFCFLFFLPYIAAVVTFVKVRRQLWLIGHQK